MRKGKTADIQPTDKVTIAFNSPNDPLTRSEQKNLEELETVISKRQGAFMEVGKALARIKEVRLYRATHKTFEEYCQDKWKFSRSQGYRLIEAAKVVGDLSPSGDNVDGLNESQLRELAKLHKEDMQATLAKAREIAGDKKPTAKTIKQAAQELGGQVIEAEVVASPSCSVFIGPSEEPRKSNEERIGELFANLRDWFDAKKIEGEILDTIEELQKRVDQLLNMQSASV